MTTLRAAVRSAYSLTTLNWVTALFMVAFHILAIAAFWFFSWTNLIVALALHWIAVGFGISLGYHRLHTHRGFKPLQCFSRFTPLGVDHGVFIRPVAGTRSHFVRRHSMVTQCIEVSVRQTNCGPPPMSIEPAWR